MTVCLLNNDSGLVLLKNGCVIHVSFRKDRIVLCFDLPKDLLCQLSCELLQRREVLERLQAEQAEMLDHERTKREEWESVQVFYKLYDIIVQAAYKFCLGHDQLKTKNDSRMRGRER